MFLFFINCLYSDIYSWCDISRIESHSFVSLKIVKTIYSQLFFFLRYVTLEPPYKRTACLYLLWITKAVLVRGRGVKLKNLTYSRGLLDLVQHKSLSFIEH